VNRRKCGLRISRLGFMLLLTLLWKPVAPAGEPIRVVTTIPILKNLVQEIGREKVVVKSLLRGVESPHTYGPKPSDLAALLGAQIFIQIGAGLEGWVDGFIKNARHEHLMIVTTSQGLLLLEDEESQTEGEAHAHIKNPHIWLDPQKVKVMVRHITEALSHIAPEEA